jgi:hypothetical protein
MAGARNGQNPDDMDAEAQGRGKRVADPELVRLLHDRITNLEKETADERRDATRQRHDFRAEVQLSIHSMREDIRTGFGAIGASISKLHDRVNDTTKDTHLVEAKTMDWRLKVAGWLLVALLGVVAYLIKYGTPWQ